MDRSRGVRRQGRCSCLSGRRRVTMWLGRERGIRGLCVGLWWMSVNEVQPFKLRGMEVIAIHDI